MPQQQRTSRRRRSQLVRELSRRFSEHELPIYASAIAFRALIAVVPLVLLGLGLLGALGLQSTWHDTIAPAIEPRVLPEVYDGINATANKILSSGTAGVITFALLLVIWDLSIGVAAIMRALNLIHDVKEDRPWLRRVAVAVGLAVAVCLCVLAAMLLLVAGPRAGGALEVVLGVLRWLLAPLLLALAVGLLVRFAPAEKPEARWASAGSLLVIVVWIVATILFRLWVTYVADFKSATGALTGLLLVTLYVFVTAAIFLVGAELDELLRKETRGRGVALPDLVTAIVRR
ncbi:MAG: YihY/virulence factor BrkB family protein [Gaiellaceae bacterium]